MNHRTDPNHDDRLPQTAWQLLHIHAETLFISDATGRLQFNADPGYPEAELDPAPRVWMGRTHTGVLWRARVDVPPDVERKLHTIMQILPSSSDPMQLPPHIDAIRTVLQDHAPIIDESAGPAYWIPPQPSHPAHVISITPSNSGLLETHFPWKQTPRALHAAGPLMATIVDGRAVAICYCARLNTVAAEAGVETTPSARGYGYGQAAVVGWAAAILQSGRIPLYSTTWDNVASQGIARRLGMIAYADTWSVS